METMNEGSFYWDLFKFFSDEHGLTLLDGQIQDIIWKVNYFEKKKGNISDAVEFAEKTAVLYMDLYRKVLKEKNQLEEELRQDAD